MWTRNWDNLVLSLTTVTGSTSTTQPDSYDPPIRYKTTGGQYKTFNSQGMQSNQTAVAAIAFPKSVRSASSGNYGTTRYEIIFGQGNTAESYEDYNMSDRIYPSMTRLSEAIDTASTIDTQTGAIKGGKIKRIMQYTGTSNITISEFGIVIAGDSTVSNATEVDCMIYRKVLDAPITLSQYDRLELVFEYPDIIPDTPYPVTP